MDVGVSTQEADTALRGEYFYFFTIIDAFMDVGVLDQGLATSLQGLIPHKFHFLIFLTQPKGRILSLNYILCYKFTLFTQIDCNNTGDKQVLYEIHWQKL